MANQESPNTDQPFRSCWIEVVEPEAAQGLLGEAYRRQRETLGEVTELTQAGSLYPELVDLRLRLYDVVERTPSNVPEELRRAVALLTSVINGCLFCTVGHTTKLEAAGFGQWASGIRSNAEEFVIGNEASDAVLDYARQLVVAPAEVKRHHVDRLRSAGWTDIDILDVNNIVAYYCYINRVASGLGLQREA
jgi:uncharacterized peroxidase-related enzyme